MRIFASAGLMAAILVLTGACDRGFTFTPVGWTRVEDGWSHRGEHFEITLLPLSELKYAQGFTPEVVVENGSRASLAFVAPVLIESSGAHYVGGFGGPPGQKTREIVLPAGESRRFPVFFSLPGPLHRAIGPEAEVTFQYRVDGGELERFSLVLRRM